MFKTFSFFLTLMFLIHCQLVNADSSNEADSIESFIPGDREFLATVNDCVNVVSGNFFQVDHDLIVDGPEPLRWLLSKLLNYMKVDDKGQRDSLFEKISPVAWQHINLYGRYNFSKSPATGHTSNF